MGVFFHVEEITQDIEDYSFWIQGPMGALHWNSRGQKCPGIRQGYEPCVCPLSTKVGDNLCSLILDSFTFHLADMRSSQSWV
jgi:hypothetical protein